MKNWVYNKPMLNSFKSQIEGCLGSITPALTLTKDDNIVTFAIELKISMIRTIITADRNKLILLLPDDFLGKQIEVIAFVIEEAKSKAAELKKTKTFSAIQLDTRGFKFNRDEANER